MTGKTFKASALLAIGVSTAQSGPASAGSAIAPGTDILPPQVTAHMAQDRADCTTGDAAFLDGFVTGKDVNGDGKPDYILDYGRFSCGGSTTTFCGSAGCLTTVFASRGEGYVTVLDENVRGLEFRMVDNKPAMILELHGSACGKAGAEPCETTLIWKGETFSPAR